ncbi:uncharacterized protein BDZ83DRAFT_717886 [Colletotrichum acutatum]|uniref:Uncharacterized protein n=1 Tax=Glomerella acutata TaxID=27357 RepID=A0AAD8UT90_GLOAC|nr:uncharacterized protein BDZ83DRAFT_717886 [Colletotrichum acutatum]KAK1727369.1 hypothetical protein BDZ83DRAFT_717886 [Colletotrichum acutatum]
MFVRLQDHQEGMDRLPPPPTMSYHQSRTDDVPRVLPSLSSFSFDDRMDVDARNDTKPGQRHEVEVATTLASMASFNIKSPTLPSPTQSFTSIKTNHFTTTMTRSTNSQFSSPEPRSPDLPSVNSQLSFTKDSTAQITLPRLRELDLRLPEPEFVPSPSFMPSAMTGGPRRSSIDSLGSFQEPRIDLSSPTAYRIPMPPMAYPDALPSPTFSNSHRNPLSPPSRRLQHRLPVTLRTGCSPSRRPRRSPTGSRCNVKYTIQQVDFIDYFRVDHHLSWKEVEAKYASVFPEDAAKGHKRGPQGLQGVYYRKNKQIPATDPNNLLVFDEDDNPKTFQCDVREQGKKMNNSIGLLGMHPERAITYAWVSEEHKRQYDKLGRARQAQLDAAEARKKRRRAIQNSRL